MRRLLLCLVLLLPNAAFAADTGWTAEMEEDEGGPVMVASVTAEAADPSTAPSLRMMCAGSDGVNLRYTPPSNTGQPGDTADFTFENEVSQLTLHLVYEDMDGAFATYVPPSDPILELLRTGTDVEISYSSGNSPAQDFSLKGSSKAIGKLLKTCE